MADAVPSLEDDLGVQNAIDNIGEPRRFVRISCQSLERFLSDCSVDELKYIEDSSTTDISRATNGLWKNFFKHEFGAKSVDLEVEKMEKNNDVKVSWKQLYETKLKDREDKLQKSSARMRESYKIEETKKRKVQLCNKIPPSINDRKRRFCDKPPSSHSSNKKNKMKKAKVEFLNSREVKNLAAMKRIKH